jgi:hypothetical protein
MTTTTYTFSTVRKDANDCLAGHTALVYRMVHAGICGPFVTFDLDDDTNVDEVLATYNLRRTGTFRHGEELLEEVR